MTTSRCRDFDGGGGNGRESDGDENSSDGDGWQPLRDADDGGDGDVMVIDRKSVV